MEKYKMFADPGTGKNPFLPQEVHSKKQSGLADKFMGIPRLMVFFLLAPFYITSSYLGLHLFARLIAKILLLLLGVKVDTRSKHFAQLCDRPFDASLHHRHSFSTYF